MVFLVRKMRSIPALRRFKVVPLEITDPGFAAQVARKVSDRAKASEMGVAPGVVGRHLA